MAWFKFFGKQDDTVAKQAPTESVEAMRKRALHRLIGSAVLVLAGVVGFPMLFDSQPRPVSIDIPIEIPDKTKVKPLVIAPPASAAMQTPAAVVSAKTDTKNAGKVDVQASLGGKEEIVPSKPAFIEQKTPPAQENRAQAAIKNEATVKADETAKTKAVEAEKAKNDKAAQAEAAQKKTAEAAQAKAAEAAKAKALLEGKIPAATAAAPAVAGERFIVQFGAYSDADKAREARQRVEKAGLKTYSQIAKTADGERIRVRVGPFATRAEADKAATKIKALDLPAAILTL
jgi:DedD protein